jgi:hypothetical protein
LDFGNKWVNNVAYAEFAYNNSYQFTTGMAPFEALYGRKCQSPLYLAKLGRDQSVPGTLDLESTESTVD